MIFYNDFLCARAYTTHTHVKRRNDFLARCRVYSKARDPRNGRWKGWKFISPRHSTSTSNLRPRARERDDEEGGGLHLSSFLSLPRNVAVGAKTLRFARTSFRSIHPRFGASPRRVPPERSLLRETFRSLGSAAFFLSRPGVTRVSRAKAGMSDG